MASIKPDIEWICLTGSEAEGLRPGELVSSEPGGMPIYRILSLAEGGARLRDLRDGAERLCPLARMPWKALPVGA